MAIPVRCQVESAHVRADQADALTALIHQLFNRRHLSYIASNERTWLTVELVQSLRRQSTVYQAMSSKTTGPLPFALGYFRVAGGELEPVSNAIPLDDPEVLVRLLSEYIEPGARLVFETDTGTEAWTIAGKDEVTCEQASSAAADGASADDA